MYLWLKNLISNHFSKINIVPSPIHLHLPILNPLNFFSNTLPISKTLSTVESTSFLSLIVIIIFIIKFKSTLFIATKSLKEFRILEKQVKKINNKKKNAYLANNKNFYLIL